MVVVFGAKIRTSTITVLIRSLETDRYLLRQAGIVMMMIPSWAPRKSASFSSRSCDSFTSSLIRALFLYSCSYTRVKQFSSSTFGRYSWHALLLSFFSWVLASKLFISNCGDKRHKLTKKLRSPSCGCTVCCFTQWRCPLLSRPTSFSSWSMSGLRFLRIKPIGPNLTKLSSIFLSIIMMWGTILRMDLRCSFTG